VKFYNIEAQHALQRLSDPEARSVVRDAMLAKGIAPEADDGGPDEDRRRRLRRRNSPRRERDGVSVDDRGMRARERFGMLRASR